MKKLLLTFLSVLMTVSVSAQQRSGTCHENINWSFNDADLTLTISAVEGTDGRMGDHSTTTLPAWASYQVGIFEFMGMQIPVTLKQVVQKVNVAEGVTYVGSYSFSGFTALTEVSLPSTLVEIGSHAFDGSTSLTTISGTASNVTSVGANAFNSTQVMNNGYLQLGNTLFTATEATGDLDFTGKGITRIADKAFQNNESITSVTFDNDLEVIGKFAFASCTNLNGMVIPNSVKTIGQHAFQECTNLPVVGDYQMAGEHIIVKVVDIDNTEYTIGDDIIYVAEDAFDDCSETSIVYCNQTVAPLAGANVFTNVSFIYVPDGAEQSYTNAWGVKADKVNTTDVKIGATGYATVALRHSAKVPAGVKAYTATIDGSSVKLTEVKNGKMAAGQGYVLVGTAGEFSFGAAGEAVTEGNENHMVGVLENTLLSGSHIYMLSLFQGQVGFRSLLESSYTLGAGKAYLDANLSTSTTSAMDFMFCSLEGNQTAIDSVTAEQSNARKSIYSVSGQRLSSPRKGLNIVDGKVVIF